MHTLLRLIAPILSFTAEEAWQSIGGGESIFLETWHALPAVPDDQALMARWAKVREVRAEVQRHLESLREAGMAKSRARP